MNISTWYAGGKRYTEYRTRESSSSSSSDGETSTITSKDWKNMIEIAEKAQETFDLYPWHDEPKDLKGKECISRVTWLSLQRGYPFKKYFRNERRLGYVDNLSDSNAIRLLYLCHKVKHKLPFDKRNFYHGLGDIRTLQAKVQGESCNLL